MISYSMLTCALAQAGNKACVEAAYYLPGQYKGIINQYVKESRAEIDVGEVIYMDGYVHVALNYVEKPLMNLWGIKASNRGVYFYGHQWNGYNIEHTDVRDGVEYVFVTETGQVYHRSRNCTHLMLSISSVPASGLTDQYRACERCDAVPSGMVYITDEGECYHKSVECSGLKRSVRSIPKTQAVGYRACSRCGEEW